MNYRLYRERPHYFRYVKFDIHQNYPGCDAQLFHQHYRQRIILGLHYQDHQLRLNSIIHPYVFQEIDKNFDDVLEKGTYDIFVVDAALIYESGADTHMDYVIVITALLKVRMERVLQRETLIRDEILKRMDLQWSEEEKIALSDFVIHNDGTEEELRVSVTDIYNQLV